MYVLGAFFMSTMIRAATWNSFPALDKDLMSEEYIDYFPLARYSQLAYNFDAFLLLGATLKVAKYLQLIEGADMISRVFSFAASNLGFVVIFFALIFYGFLNLAQQIFGTLERWLVAGALTWWFLAVPLCARLAARRGGLAARAPRRAPGAELR